MIRTLGARHRPANQALGPSMVNWLPFRRSRRSARPGFPTPPVVLRAGVLALAVPGRRVVDLEEELQDVPVGGPPGIKDDLHRLGMAPMVVLGRALVLPAGVSDAGGDHPVTVAPTVQCSCRTRRRPAGRAPTDRTAWSFQDHGPDSVRHRRESGPHGPDSMRQPRSTRLTESGPMQVRAPRLDQIR